MWGSLAKVYEADFAPFLPGVVQGLFDCINQEEADLEVELGQDAKDLLGKEVTIAGRKVKVAAVSDDDEPEDGGIEDVEIDEDDDDWGDLDTVTPLAMEKEIAIEVLGDVVGNTKAAFVPYYEKTIETILPLTEHSYENIRKATLSTLHRAYAALWQVSEEAGTMEKWKPGLPVQTETPAELKKFGDVLMQATLQVWEDEEDRYVSTFPAILHFRMMSFIRYPSSLRYIKDVHDVKAIHQPSDLTFYHNLSTKSSVVSTDNFITVRPSPKPRAPLPKTSNSHGLSPLSYPDVLLSPEDRSNSPQTSLPRSILAS